MVCGKGGYVRAIARDLGRALGCLGHVASLRRVWSGPFDVDQAVPFDRVDRANQAELDAALLPCRRRWICPNCPRPTWAPCAS